MTPEEKNAILQFMGVTYGHTHKLDKGIVGDSPFVKPMSFAVREKFEEVLKSSTEDLAQNNNFPNEVVEPVLQPVLQPMIQQSVLQPPTFTAEPVQPILNTVDSEILTQLKNINLHLDRIVNIMGEYTTKTNVRTIKKIKDKLEV
jgi:hypothetical protein